ncbi:MAG: GspE/PulE family protein [Gemmatimonadaceae bacterium]|jgi:type II secretory ATPase GspE/PulE/Tfp pilus assembly ATPase PilB-like protein|nr:GspE/PulE family protein [Gemmatimonadaceae bacterium]
MHRTSSTTERTAKDDEARAASPPWHSLVSRELMLATGACPLELRAGNVLRVRCATEDGITLAHELAFVLGCDPLIEIAERQEVTAAIERTVTTHDRGGRDGATFDERDALDDPRLLAQQPPVVRFVSLLLREAILADASDVHLDTTPAGLSVRLRIDGVLVDGPSPGAVAAAAVISRLKLLADLDIAERRRPQDGSMRARIGDADVDLRVATVPTVHGESMVVRVLDSRAGIIPLERLGMPPVVLDGVRQALARREGLFLVTGPSGSGKTTTLYAALATRVGRGEKLLSVEEPVEIQLAGVTQVPVHREAGVSFASALRSLLRHDPDVLFVGELRDAETASVAVQAAMTGHLVLATLHTNDAPGAVSRLVDLGVPRFLVAETLVGVLAQRLVRRRCRQCHGDGAEPTEPGAAHCPRCRGAGLSGRIGIFEYLPNTAAVASEIAQGVDRAALLAAAEDAGWIPLGDDAAAKVRDGLTTAQEVARAITA